MYKNGLKNLEEFLVILKNGVIVNLHISAFRGKRTLTDGIDLYAPEQDKFIDNFVSLGMKYVIPKSIINKIGSVESQARKFLANMSYQTVWGYFVPFTAFDNVTKRLEEYKTNYESVIQNDLLENYDEIVIKTREEYIDHYTFVFQKEHGHSPSRQEIDDLVEKLRIPSKTQLLNHYSFEWEYSTIPLPSELEDDLLRKKELQFQMEIERAKTDEEKRVIMDRQNLLKKMNEEIVKKAKENKEKMIDKFINTIFYKLKSNIHNVLSNVLEGLRNNKDKKLHGRKVLQLNNLVSYIREMNFVGDPEIDKWINDIDGELADTTNTTSLETLCEEITTQLKEEVVGLEQQDRWDIQKRL